MLAERSVALRPARCAPAEMQGPAPFRTPAPTWIEWDLLDEGLDPILGEVDKEGERDGVHEPVDFGPLALQELDENPRDEAGTDADRDVVGERHEDDGQKGDRKSTRLNSSHA